MNKEEPQLSKQELKAWEDVTGYRNRKATGGSVKLPRHRLGCQVSRHRVLFRRLSYAGFIITFVSSILFAFVGSVLFAGHVELAPFFYALCASGIIGTILAVIGKWVES